MSSSRIRALAAPPDQGIDREYARGLAEGRFMLQRCAGCHGVRWPPTPRCARCTAPDHEWIAAAGRGRLWSWIVMHQRYFADAEDQIPYVIGYIELVEGPMVMARLRSAAGARCDATVEFRSEDSREAQIAVFALADAPA